MTKTILRSVYLFTVLSLLLAFPIFTLAQHSLSNRVSTNQKHFGITAAAPPLTATPLKVSLTKSLYNSGEEVQVVVETPAAVLVSSDFSKNSTPFDIFGTKTISVGPINGEGYYAVDFKAGDSQLVLQVLFLKQGTKLEAISLTAPVTSATLAPSAQLGPALEKFLKNINANRLGRAFAAAKTKFPRENVIALGNTVVICLITIPTGMWVTCATTAGGVVVEFMFKVNEELIDVLGPAKDKVLTAAEATLLKKWVGVAKIIPDAHKLIFGADKATKVLAALKVGLGAGEVVVNNAEGQFAFKTASDFVKKYEVIYSLKP